MRYLHELKTRKEVIDFLGVCSSKLAKAMKDGGGFNVNGVDYEISRQLNFCHSMRQSDKCCCGEI